MSKQERKIWICKSCNIYFEPKPPEYRCPACQGTTTVPARDFNEEKHVLWEPEKLELSQCTKCGELMASGYIVEKNFPLDLSTIGEGIYWTPDEWGSIGSRVAIKSYACPKCGTIELKVRRASSRGYIQQIRDYQLGKSK